MKINNIKLCNISSYSGVCSFDFKISDDKNVVLIGGQNGTGKTSLFTALKLGLYGHLCFNYQANSSMYLSKIRELINHDTFTSKDIVAFIEIELEIPHDRESLTYTVLREWKYINQKIVEKYTVIHNDKLLNDDEIIFFQNYLYTIAPPNIFDFFFFDGERIADFFSTNSYNSYIKNALLTLCSYDTFELIRKFSNNFVLKNDGDKNIISTYENVLTKIEDLKLEIEAINKSISIVDNEILDVIDQKESLSNEFKSSGGLTEEQKFELFEKSKEQEKIKNESNLRIKSFVEGLMPFVITKDFADKIKTQISLETDYQKYDALNDKLNSNAVNDAISKTITSYKIDNQKDFISDLIKTISIAVKPNIDENDFKLIHDLSKEQQEKVFAVLSIVDKFSANGILKAINLKEMASIQTVEINKKLRSSLSETDAKIFANKFDDLSKKEISKVKELESLKSKLSISEDELQKLNIESEKIRNQLMNDAKNRNIYELTNRMSSMFDDLINKLTKSKFIEIESYMLYMLKKIMRKDNFIDLIELDGNFNIFLYKKQVYRILELENLIRNVGTEELIKRIGSKGIEKLLEEFKIDSISKLKSIIKKNNGQLSFESSKTIDLYKKIDFNQLSKGEKQIFILSLYYAIIKVSKKEIPFIIDTPYARIDTDHREQISTVFFPEISEQVVILSTDEEISFPYYKILKPFITKEYLLNYNELDSKTTVTEGYFYKE